MLIKRLFIAASLCVLIPVAASARPVSYPEGWTVMLRNNVDANSAHIHYTLDTQHSLGLRLRYDREADALFTGGQLNRLFKRWNKPDSQANIYGRIAVGQVSEQSGLNRDDEVGVFLGLSADWETRRWFVEGAAELWDQGEFGYEESYHSRLGVAPYIANTGALHTWFMVETHYNPRDDEEWGATALVRFFKGAHLAEFGVDNDGEPMINYIYRY